MCIAMRSMDVCLSGKAVLKVNAKEYYLLCLVYIRKGGIDTCRVVKEFTSFISVNKHMKYKYMKKKN